MPLIESHPWTAIPIFIGSQLSIVFGVPAAQFASSDFPQQSQCMNRVDLVVIIVQFLLKRWSRGTLKSLKPLKFFMFRRQIRLSCIG